MSQFIQQQRREVLWECLIGLEAVENVQGLNSLSRAAYEFIRQLYAKSNRGGNVTYEQMSNPVRVAHAAIQKAGLTCAQW